MDLQWWTRSRSAGWAGLALAVLAVVLGWLPGAEGIGLAWSAFMLAGAGLAALHDARAAGLRLPDLLAYLPEVLWHPLVPALYATAVAIHAVLLMRFAPVPLLWALAAALLAVDQVRQGTVLSLLRSRFDLRLAWWGYRRYVVVGVLVCLASLFAPWGREPGFWLSGYDRRPGLGPGGAEYVYSLRGYAPGQPVPGRARPLAFFAVAVLGALALWSMYLGEGPFPAWLCFAGAALALLVTAWWLPLAGSSPASWLFGAGLAAIGGGMAMICCGQHEGRYDLSHVLRRLRR